MVQAVYIDRVAYHPRLERRLITAPLVRVAVHDLTTPDFTDNSQSEMRPLVAALAAGRRTLHPAQACDILLKWTPLTKAWVNRELGITRSVLFAYMRRWMYRTANDPARYDPHSIPLQAITAWIIREPLFQ